MAYRFVGILRLVVAAAVIAACASDAEKQARRDNAFDMAGDYTATKQTGSASDMKITITDAGSRSNISAQVTRQSGLESSEVSLLNRHGITDTAGVQAAFGNPITLDGSHIYYLDGGANISDDFGKSDRFYVCSNTYQIDANRKLQYCLSGRISQSDWVLRGALTLNYEETKMEKGSDGKPTAKTYPDSVSIGYNAKPGHSYFEQMFGTWTGSFSQKIFAPSNDVNGISISLHSAGDGAGFLAIPSKATVTVDGHQYRYDRTQELDLRQVKDMSIPIFEVVYQGVDQPNDRVVLFCQIYSLGKMTGSAVLIQGNQQNQFASFSMKRN